MKFISIIIYASALLVLQNVVSIKAASIQKLSTETVQEPELGIGNLYQNTSADIKSNCGGNGTCLLRNGENTCTCKEGYALNGEICEECDCGEEGLCSFGKYGKACYCYEGYALYDDICKECDCYSGTCAFTQGRKVCGCYIGHSEDNGYCKYCDCGFMGRCSFENGEKICDCKAGYSPKDGRCEKCDCGEMGFCSFTNDAKICTCKAGYFDKDGNCTKCDCGDMGFCSFKNGTKICTCKAGYDDKDGVCAECSCGENGRCYFGNGAKMCDCNKDYSLETGICRECSCGENGRCSFENGVKMCDCNKGYSLEDGICRECSCGENGICYFENGLKNCDCNKGYSLEAGICRECNCGDNGTCFLRNGVRTCACDKDYVFNGDICKECYCGEGGICSFKEGAKACACYQDYSLNDEICEECNCGANGRCYFKNGVKICACDNGYAMDGEICKEIVITSPTSTTASESTSPATQSTTSNIPTSDACNDDEDCRYMGLCKQKGEKRFCECRPGLRGDRCETVVDCATGKYKDCSGENGTCFYDAQKREAVCTCSTNKKLDDLKNVCKTCVCGEKGTCSFISGKKTCECQKSSAYDEDDGICKETCGFGSCLNLGSCVKKGEAGFCKCKPGMIGDRCETVTDCITGKYKNCNGERGTCFFDHRNGRATCICDSVAGHKTMKVHPYENICKETCNNDSECLNNGACQEMDGVKFCECKRGVSGDRCQTVDECATGRYKHCTRDRGTCFFDYKRAAAVCMCSGNRKLHHEENICKETCRENNDCQNGGVCEGVQGKKFCTCGRGVTGDLCETIVDCTSGKYKDCRGENGNCSYNHQMQTAVCTCSNDKALQPYENICKECDCGVYGSCSFIGYQKVCSCSLSTSEKDGKCVECDCGSYGVCTFEAEEKKCICGPRTIQIDGKCVAIKSTTERPRTTMIMTTPRDCYCGKNSYSCRFDWRGGKICGCHFGYVQKDGYCTEICSDDKCLHGKCLVRGQDYECKCFKGYTGSRCENKIETKSDNPAWWRILQISSSIAIFVLLSAIFCFHCQKKK
ncbi:uncharacterized protein CDAR_422613 [Caerostris darwini]|uniref:EGF-like domain-containing protein n=1 Tax=Caerostris darwini TaxID=1538125 RepID=A0AAV4QVW7_9ARAC|nr:uncharacterized protein CDAR_422613 [Caerostris darwini]